MARSVGLAQSPLSDKISTILLETRRCAAAIKYGQKYIRPRYDLLLLNIVYTLGIRAHTNSHLRRSHFGRKLIIEISRTPIKGDHLGKSLSVLFGGWCRFYLLSGRPIEGSKKNFPPGNFCVAATGREKIARHCRGTVGEIFLSETNPFYKIAAYVIICTL